MAEPFLSLQKNKKRKIVSCHSRVWHFSLLFPYPNRNKEKLTNIWLRPAKLCTEIHTVRLDSAHKVYYGSHHFSTFKVQLFWLREKIHLLLLNKRGYFSFVHIYLGKYKVLPWSSYTAKRKLSQKLLGPRPAASRVGTATFAVKLQMILKPLSMFEPPDSKFSHGFRCTRPPLPTIENSTSPKNQKLLLKWLSFCSKSDNWFD